MTLFTEADHQRVREAVALAERRTSGEIVPYVVPQSGTYEVAVWRGASLASVVTLLGAMLFVQLYEGWGLPWLYTGWGVIVLVLLAGVLGALAARLIPSVKRLLAGGGLLDRTVHGRAMQAFVEEEVFNTRDRTGILLFVSLFEHRIEVIGDAGINAKVEPDAWVNMVLRIREGIQQGKLADGLVEATRMCGDLLETCGIALRTDDTNELSDDIRFPKNRG